MFIIKQIASFILYFFLILGFWYMLFLGMEKESQRGYYVKDPELGYSWKEPNV